MKREEFVSLAVSYLGFPAVGYKGSNVGDSEDGFDCSGFINFLLRKADYPHLVPRHASELFDTFGILIHEQFVEAGDLVFISNRGGTYPDHVGIMIAHDRYIHSPGRNGTFICTSRVDKKLIEPANNKAAQIYYMNPIGFKRITIPNGRYQKMFLE